MATLEKIRNKAGWLISLVLGLALLAFILGDFLRKGNNRQTDTNIAEVLGEEIPYSEYQSRLQTLTENYKANTGKTGLDDKESEMMRDQTWDALIKDIVMNKEFDELGIEVSSEELYDMVQGKNLDPSILQAPIFKNQQTGQFDRNLVIRYLKYIENDADEKDRKMWLAFEKELENNRKITKYNNLIKGAFYITKSELEMKMDEENKRVDIEYTLNPFNSISDSTVTLTDADYKSYYDEHKYQFEQDASRTIEYITYNIVPSKEDIERIETEMKEMKEEFAKAKDGIQYVNINSDMPYQPINYKPGQLDPQIDSVMFAADSGFVYGPYIVDGNIYKLAKLIATKMMPDSVKARHILLQVKTQEEYVKAKSLADSLKTLVEGGADFAELAKQYSADKASAVDGGDLGFFTEGKMVKPFEDFCFNAKAGDIGIVNSQFGIHIIEVTELGKLAKRVNVAFIQRELLPSQTTMQAIYAKAGKFAVENNTEEKFNAYLAEHDDLTKKIASNLKENDKTIAGLESPREIIRWAYKAEKGEVSQPFELPNQFVVAVLTEIKEKGTAPLEEVKEEIERFVMNTKKFEMLAPKMKGSTVNEIASAIGQEVKTAGNMNFNAFSIPGAGFEPDVIAVATAMNEGEMSTPIEGRAGAYVFKVTKVVKDIKADENKIKSKLSSGFKNRVSYQVFDALKENANIVDNRAKFF
jgi:peptidyl-prolyl cis-trans isomerase D